MFTEDHIFLKIPGKNQKEVLRSLAKLAFQLGVVSSTDDLLQDYLDREQESTTGFGW
ncbi:PTS sugar transporter subunit IIA, partial [Oenococcus oeni]